jgi:RNA polymerase primary sigma factor
MAAASGLSEARVIELLELVEDPVSLETPVGTGDSSYSDLIEDESVEGPEQATSDRLRSAELAQALMQLEPRLRGLIERRFGLAGHSPGTLDEIGRELGVTRERVRQLEARALRELRSVAPELAFYLETE